MSDVGATVTSKPKPVPIWPPLVWVVMYASSLFILMGLGPWDTDALIIGMVLAVGGFAFALYLAARPWGGRKRSNLVAWTVGGLGLFYAVCGIIGAFAGIRYAVAGILAALFPVTSAALLAATVGQKTRERDGRLRDTSADDHEDPFPGIGLDDTTPLGDTPEHSDAVEGAPVRPSAAERFERRRQQHERTRH